MLHITLILTCAFLLFMESSSVSIAHARDPLNAKTVYIQNAESGIPYHCLSCNGILFARKGTQNEHHFYHQQVTDCVGTGESIEHRSAKHRLQALLRRGFKLRVYNCEQVCSLTCFTDIEKRTDEDVQVEFRLPEDAGIADVAIVNKETKQARFLLEVLHTHATTVGRPEPWFEFEAKAIHNAKNIRNGVVHLHERRQQIPVTRNCRAHTFPEKVWLAGLDDLSEGINDTLDKRIEEQWNLNVMQGSETDPEYPPEYQAQLRLNIASKAEKVRLYAAYYPDVYNLMDWCNDAKAWAHIYTNDLTSIKRARMFIKKHRRCIHCEKRLSNEVEEWKILCTKCWKERRALRDND